MLRTYFDLFWKRALLAFKAAAEARPKEK
jgi:hypothetical protein